jgi:hypothetical protein
MLSSLPTFLIVLIIVCHESALVEAVHRTIGPANDPRFIAVSKICNASDPENWKFGQCSLMINCVYNNLAQALLASLGAGANIAALIPTILALIGMYVNCELKGR